MEAKAAYEIYMAIGAGGLCVVAIIIGFFILLKDVKPAMTKVQEESRIVNEVIKTNTHAIKELSQSNQNIASALTVLDQSMKIIASHMEKSDRKDDEICTRLGKMDDKLIVIGERVSKQS